MFGFRNGPGNQSPVAAVADASEITGLPRDNFEVYEISKDEFEEILRIPHSR
jgi:hypothetical protein